MKIGGFVVLFILLLVQIYSYYYYYTRITLYKHYVQLGQTKTRNEFLKIADWKQSELNKNYFQF